MSSYRSHKEKTLLEQVERALTPEEESALFTSAGYDFREAEKGGYSNYSYWQSTFRAFFKNRVAVFLLLVMAALLWFVEAGRLPAWVLLVVIVREFAVTALRLIAVERGRVIAAAWSGKVKTASTMVCICLMLLIARPALDLVCTAVILVTTVHSGAEYFLKNKDVVEWSNL